MKGPDREPAAAGQALPEGVVRALLAVAAVSLAGFVICAWGWHRAATAEPSLEALAPEDRLELAEELLAASPGFFVPTWFEPAMGYTLQRGTELRAFGDSFKTNRLGFRTGPEHKAPGVFRVVFVGDSWTYGLGVRAAESFPEVLARLANEHSGLETTVEARNLALPGYNLLNGLAALEYLFERLQPDAVVVCPSSNDHHSTLSVLPTGSLSTAGVMRDQFGEPHNVKYHFGAVDSHRFRARWRMSFDRLRTVEGRLQRRGVPLLLFFLARWKPAEVHAHVAGAGLSSPYVIAPVELTRGEWAKARNHGTPAANELYARMVYRGAAHLLGWRPLPEEDDDERAVVEVFGAPPPSPDWQAARDRGLTRKSKVPATFRPSATAWRQSTGPINSWKGRMGRATTILVRPRPRARRLRIAVRRLPDVPSLYPLDLTVSIPSPAGGTRVVTTVPGDGPDVHRFSLAIPDDLEPGSTLDVLFVAGRTIAGPRNLTPRSLMIESIEGVRR